MKARLHVAMPFNMLVPEGAQFLLYTTEDTGCEVTTFPPTATDRPAPTDRPDKIKMDGTSTFAANGLHIEFKKPNFDRRKGANLDPAPEVIERAVFSFVRRLRFVTQGAHIRLAAISQLAWRIRYLNDDGTELPEDPQLVRGRGGVGFSFPFVSLNPDIWNDMFSLDSEFKAPVWHDLLLDATWALPHVGAALVLAYSALEVFIASALDAVAGPVQPASLWAWINARRREPTVEEQFDSLLLTLTGHSLKAEAPVLWQALDNLRKARNAFVHGGTATVDGKPVSVDEAQACVDFARQIIDCVEQWLPTGSRMRRFPRSVLLEFEHQFFRPPAPLDGPALEEIP